MFDEQDHHLVQILEPYTESKFAVVRIDLGDAFELMDFQVNVFE